MEDATSTAYHGENSLGTLFHHSQVWALALFWIFYLLLPDKVNDLHLGLRRMIFRRQHGPYSDIRDPSY